jgi:hypothetical protein
MEDFIFLPQILERIGTGKEVRKLDKKYRYRRMRISEKSIQTVYFISSSHQRTTQ